jgi:hypothetical protein
MLASNELGKLKLEHSNENDSMEVIAYKDGTAGFWVYDAQCNGKYFFATDSFLIDIKNFLNEIDLKEGGDD